MTGACAVVVAVLALQGHPRVATAYVLIAASGGALNAMLKVLVHRPRPPGAERFLYGHSWSFPSGHAMGSIIGYGLLCFVAANYWSLSRTSRLLVFAGAGLLVMLIGASRIALGVHYRGDVAGGWAIGALWLYIGLSLFRVVESRRAAGASVTPAR